MLDALLTMIAAEELPSARDVTTLLEAGLGTRVTVLEGTAPAAADLAHRARAQPGRAITEGGRHVVAFAGLGEPLGLLVTGPPGAGPRDAGPRDNGPRDNGPRDNGPRNIGPRDNGPRNIGPPDAGRRDNGPLDNGPLDNGPLDIGPLEAGSVSGLVRAARAMAALRRRREAVLRAHHEVRGELLAELLGRRHALPPSLRELAARRRFDLDRTQVLVAVEDAVPDRTLADVAAHLGGVGGRYGDTLVALVPGTDARAAAEDVSARLHRVCGVRAAVCAADPADPASGALAAAFDAARHGLLLLRALDQPQVVATARELAVHRVLFDADRAPEVRAFADDVLRPLLAYDAEHRTELVRTVRVFLAAGGNAAQAARELFVHPNTMTKRLDRITRLLGAGWQSGPHDLRVRLALHLLSAGRPAGAG
ncbi:helix-turn-helix domain-containing protein [Actinoplanes sp. NPDC051494]|uniref:PucR family transcriptional regulator n=1 Tax=Actinoplanes sp. NPDC051494 TaxID=3363907 RepID=UPI0037AA4BD9